jgi:hypothetical protein
MTDSPLPKADAMTGTELLSDARDTSEGYTNREIAKWTKNATIVALVALVCTLGGFAFSSYGEKVQVVDKMESISTTVTKHDHDIEVMKEGQFEMKGDLREIKTSLSYIRNAVTKESPK